MAQAELLVFLDDAQYSKNSYINRVQIDAGGTARWLTVPVSYRFGDAINRVRPADSQWRQAHLDMLKSYYSGAAEFPAVYGWMSELYSSLPDADLAAGNRFLIKAVAEKLGIVCHYKNSSEIDTGGAAGDDRLIVILRSLGPDVAYLSGKGGANYQGPGKFEAAGIALKYSEFVHPAYTQGHAEFLPGLSVFDALFRAGFDGTAALIASSRKTKPVS